MKVALAALFVLALAALIVVPVAQVSLAKRRSRKFVSFAARRELTYNASWSKLAYRWPGQPCVDTASNQQVKNVLRGDFEGRAFKAFDYSCELRYGVVQDGPQAVTVTPSPGEQDGGQDRSSCRSWLDAADDSPA